MSTLELFTILEEYFSFCRIKRDIGQILQELLVKTDEDDATMFDKEGRVIKLKLLLLDIKRSPGFV